MVCVRDREGNCGGLWTRREGKEEQGRQGKREALHELRWKKRGNAATVKRKGEGYIVTLRGEKRLRG